MEDSLFDVDDYGGIPARDGAHTHTVRFHYWLPLHRGPSVDAHEISRRLGVVLRGMGIHVTVEDPTVEWDPEVSGCPQGSWHPVVAEVPAFSEARASEYLQRMCDAALRQIEDEFVERERKESAREWTDLSR